MKNYRSLRLIAAFVMVFGLAGLAAAQVKPDSSYQQWTKADVIKLLSDSPWSKTQTQRVMRRGQVRSIAGQNEAAVGDRTGHLSSAEDAYEYSFTMRLRSALHVRQAIVRLVQLDSGYDQMDKAARKAFDAQTKELLECKECADYYVVSVGFASSNNSVTDLIYDWFNGQTLPGIKGYVYLANARGERRDLARFIPPKSPGEEVFFLFPRLDEKGQPLLTTEDKKLLFRMSDIKANSVTNFTLDVSKLIVDGKVEF
ncbi:MAG: hypothetical protein ICV68_10150 [Pyrinomonadaceae bacterium]|nr:hypothetical protein [Pyrinomonadaceae bacterium]